MGGSGSKVGAAIGRAARKTTDKGASSAKHGGFPPPLSHLSREDDALKQFKPTKVVEMSRPEARTAAKQMYDQQVAEMDPEILRQFKMMGPAVKQEISDQKLVPDTSELQKDTKLRPLPKDRSRIVITANEVDEVTGQLTQTQALDLLAISGEVTPQLENEIARKFNISEEDAKILAKYYRTPDIRYINKEAIARWSWPKKYGTSPSATASR